MSTVPFCRSYPATVSGMRSPFSSTRKIINWPGNAFFATAGARISIFTTVGFKISFCCDLIHFFTLLERLHKLLSPLLIRSIVLNLPQNSKSCGQEITPFPQKKVKFVKNEAIPAPCLFSGSISYLVLPPHLHALVPFEQKQRGHKSAPFRIFCLLLRCAPRTAPKNDINECTCGRCSSNEKNSRPIPLCWGNGFQTSCSIGIRHEFLCSSLRIEHLCGAVCQKNRILHTILTGRRNQQHRGRHTGEQAKEQQRHTASAANGRKPRPEPEPQAYRTK